MSGDAAGAAPSAGGTAGSSSGSGGGGATRSPSTGVLTTSVPACSTTRKAPISLIARVRRSRNADSCLQGGGAHTLSEAAIARCLTPGSAAAKVSEARARRLLLADTHSGTVPSSTAKLSLSAVSCLVKDARDTPMKQPGQWLRRQGRIEGRSNWQHDRGHNRYWTLSQWLFVSL